LTSGRKAATIGLTVNFLHIALASISIFLLKAGKGLFKKTQERGEALGDCGEGNHFVIFLC
jgi:hypothetical protein